MLVIYETSLSEIILHIHSLPQHFITYRILPFSEIDDGLLGHSRLEGFFQKVLLRIDLVSEDVEHQGSHQKDKSEEHKMECPV